MKTVFIDSLLCYISFCFLYSSVFFLQKVTKLPLACHQPLLTWKVDKLNKCMLFELLLYGFTQNTEYIYLHEQFISIIWICQLYFMLFHMQFTWHGICINFNNQQIYYLINLHFFVACVVQPKSVLSRYLETLLGFQNYELLDFILQCYLCSSVEQ